MPHAWAAEQLPQLDAGWQRLMRAIYRLGPAGFDRSVTPGGWTVKEMLAHLAFWDETSLPVIENMYRGKPDIPERDWYGGDDLELGPNDPWPDADTHNAREAKWARSHSNQQVLQRMADGRAKLKRIIATVTDEESRGPVGEQWSAASVNRHVDGHIAQLNALPVSRS